MTTEEKTQSRPFYETDEGLERDQAEAIEKQDRELGWDQIRQEQTYYQQQRSEWSYEKLLERYEHLKRVTLENMPEVWTGLEFALSVKSTLNMSGNTLPFPGILLGPSSGSKTVIIEMFKGYRDVYYLDSFSPRSFVSHNSAVPKEKLKFYYLSVKVF